ncbi:MAG: SPOR domain-containing protein, partial [Bradyrhizobium sp.]
MNSTQSLQKPPSLAQPVSGEVVGPGVQANNGAAIAAIPGAPLHTCESCDSLLDAQQRYCLNCGTRSRYVTNPAIDFLAAQRRKRALGAPTVADPGYGGTGITKKSLPWVAGLTVLALVVGFVVAGSRGNDNEALLAALANQKPIIVGGGATGPSTATVATLTSDFKLDEGFTVQVATVPTTADQAAVDAAKAAATAKGATAVGLITATDFTIDPDPGGSHIIYSGEFAKEKEATAALKKLKKDFPDAKVVSVKRSAAGGDISSTLKTETGEKSILAEPVTKEKVAKDKKAVEDFNKKTGEEKIKAQDDLPDA